MNNELYFQRGVELVDCIKWVALGYTDTSLPTGSIKTFVHLKQVNAEEAVATAYGRDDVWLSRRCYATGVIDTEYLLKGDDVCALGSLDLFKNFALVLSTTKRQKARFDSLAALDVKNPDVGVTEVSVYAGDIDDFKMPNTDWKPAANIMAAWDFRKAIKLNQDLSDLNKNSSSKESPPALLRFEDEMVAVISAEKSGALNGSNMIVTETPCLFPKPFTIAIRGKHLSKVGDVFSGGQSTIEVFVDDLEEPTRVKFVGSEGFIDVPTVPTYNCKALSMGALCYFYGINRRGYTEICSRHFVTAALKGFVELQTPRKGQRPDILLELAKNKLVISKREENSKKERSSVTVWGLEGVGDWVPVVVKHDLLLQSIETIEKFIAAKISDSEEFEDNIVLLKQVAIRVVKKEIIVLFIESPFYKDCRIMLICNTLENTADLQEDQ